MLERVTSLLIVLAVAALPAAGNAQDRATRYVRALADLASFGVVLLRVEGKLPDGTDILPYEATGFLMSDTGYVVTAKHVLMTKTNWSTFRTQLGDRQPLEWLRSGNVKYYGRLARDDATPFELAPAGADDANDLAVLLVSKWTEPLRSKSWHMHNLMHTEPYPRGTPVMALGFPKDISDPNPTAYGWDGRGLVQVPVTLHEGMTLSETTLTLEPGTSGGPVISLRGELVGVVHGGRDLVSSKFFTPASVLVPFLRQKGVIP